jgi:hypothetical protein
MERGEGVVLSEEFDPVGFAPARKQEEAAQ